MDYPNDAHYLHGVVGKDKSNALFSYVQLRPIVTSHAPNLRIRGLKSAAKYQIKVIEAAGRAEFMSITPPPWLKTGAVLTGSELENVGLPAPILRPENALLLEITLAK
jgi:alpha-galactosidase